MTTKATSLPIDTYPDMLIRCTCGRKCIIRWNGRKYVAGRKSWTYDVDPHDDLKSRLWNCGRGAGHAGSIFRVRARKGFRLAR